VAGRVDGVVDDLHFVVGGHEPVSRAHMAQMTSSSLWTAVPSGASGPRLHPHQSQRSNLSAPIMFSPDAGHFPLLILAVQDSSCPAPCQQ
jgi:hypothetical protein